MGCAKINQLLMLSRSQHRYKKERSLKTKKQWLEEIVETVTVDLSDVLWISCLLSLISDDVVGVVMSFGDVDRSGDVEAIFCEVDKPSRDSVVLLFLSVDKFSGEVVWTSGDVDVILNMAPYSWHCSISSGSYFNTHCMPSCISVKCLQFSKTIQKTYMIFDKIKIWTYLC